MFKLTAKVCDEEDAGTDHIVRLRFKSSNGDTCVTEELDEGWTNGWELKRFSIGFGIDVIRSKNDWEQGSTKTWKKDWLGDCVDFIPIKGLKCKFEMIRSPPLLMDPFSNVGSMWDPLKMCKLTVSFGSGSKWEWRGAKVISLEDEKSEKDWLEMQRIT